MDYLQYIRLECGLMKAISFKPYYKWITFNIKGKSVFAMNVAGKF